jgi:predicted amidohydrolase
MTTLRTGLVQMRSGPDPAQNFAQASELIESCAAQGARLIATPENTNLMQSDRAKMLAQIHRQADDPMLVQFQALAQKLDIFLLIGSMSIKVSPKKAANRSFLISPQGEIIVWYDKIHMFDVAVTQSETWCESDHIEAGSMAVLAGIDDFQLGFSICYDLRFASLYHRLASHGANLLSVPAAFTRVTGRAHWQTLLTARAIETESYVIAPAQGGKHEDGRRTWGHSMIVDPWGKIIAKLDHDDPGFVMADLDPELVRKTRHRIPVLEQAREFTGP